MEIGHQGTAGNGYTSRVWKGDGQWNPNGQYLKHGYWPFLFYFRLQIVNCKSVKSGI
jgi:hypothetical protein